MTSCAEVLNLADESGVVLAVKDGRLSLRGTAGAVAFVKKLAAEVRDELIARLTPPPIEPTHRTTIGLIFRDPATGHERVIPAGTPCRQFLNPKSALLAGVPFDHDQKWAATRNLQNGYALIWLEGMLRGVSFQDVEPLQEVTSEKNLERNRHD